MHIYKFHNQTLVHELTYEKYMQKREKYLPVLEDMKMFQKSLLHELFYRNFLRNLSLFDHKY